MPSAAVPLGTMAGMNRRLICALLATLAGASHAAPQVLRDGDIVFHTSRSAQSLAVQRATGSRYSHMGIVFLRDGKPYVFEAAAAVRHTPYAAWVAQGVGQHVVVKRLKDARARLTPAATRQLRRHARALEGKPYDLTFEWSDQRMYCSELVWKLYQRTLGIEIGQLQKIRAFNLSDPAVQPKMRERYGQRVPLDEPVISPAAMFDSPRLVTVWAH